MTVEKVSYHDMLGNATSELFDAQRVFKEKIEKMRDDMFTLGIDLQYKIPFLDAYHNENEEMFGGSLGKLPLVLMAIDHLQPHREITFYSSDVIPGGGYFDKKQHASAKAMIYVGDAIYDILVNSGNTATRLIAQELGGPERIQEYYYSNGWLHTDVGQDEATGGTLLGNTTPSDALQFIRAILNAEGPLAEIAQTALEENRVRKHGIRQNDLSSMFTVYNKTGEAPADEDTPYAIRHDAGLVIGPEVAIEYAIMTKSLPFPERPRTFIADQKIKQITQELMSHAGGNHLQHLGWLAHIKSLAD